MMDDLEGSDSELNEDDRGHRRRTDRQSAAKGGSRKGRIFGSPRGQIEKSQTIEIARKAGATLFIVGTIEHSGENWSATWRLVDARNGDNVGAGPHVEGSTLAEIANRIIADALPLIARKGGVQTAVSRKPVEGVTTDFPRAFQRYIAGMLAVEERRTDDATAELERAVA